MCCPKKQHTHQVSSVHFSPDGARLVTGSYDTTVKIWDPSTGACLETLPVDGSVSSVRFSPSGTEIAAASNEVRNYCVKIFIAETSALRCTLSGHSWLVNSVSWNNDGTKLASGSHDETVKIWDPVTCELIWTVKVYGAVYSVAFSPDSTMIAAGLDAIYSKLTLQAPLLTLDAQGGEQLRQLTGHAVSWSPDGKLLASASGIWDAATGEQLSQLQAFYRCVVWMTG